MRNLSLLEDIVLMREGSVGLLPSLSILLAKTVRNTWNRLRLNLHFVTSPAESSAQMTLVDLYIVSENKCCFTPLNSGAVYY